MAKKGVNVMTDFQKVKDSAMEMKFLGSSGLKVSALCLGTMTFGAFPNGPSSNTDEAASHALLDRFVELGGNFIDSADVYPGMGRHSGISESILGTWLQKRNREHVVVATKCRYLTDPDSPNGMGLSRKHLLWSLNQSLERLKTDYIDLYQIHGWDAGTPLEETLRTLNDVVRAGKVRHIGACNLTGWQLQKFVDYAKFMGMEKMVANQMQYNLLVRGIEDEVTEVCREEKVGLLCWSPLKGGWLTGKFKKDAEMPAGTRQEWANKLGVVSQAAAGKSIESEKTWHVLDELKNIAEANNKSMAQVALRWLVQKDLVSSVIIGATKMNQLESNMGAGAGWELTPEEMARLDAASTPEQRYPYEMAKQQEGRKRDLFRPI